MSIRRQPHKVQQDDRKLLHLNLQCANCHNKWQDQIYSPFNKTRLELTFIGRVCPRCGRGWKNHLVVIPDELNKTIPLPEFRQQRQGPPPPE